MAKPPPYYKRVTIYVTTTIATSTSEELEVLVHVQHGSNLQRLEGRIRTSVPMSRARAYLEAEAVAVAVRNSWTAALSPEMSRDDGPWSEPLPFDRDA